MWTWYKYTNKYVLDAHAFARREVEVEEDYRCHKKVLSSNYLYTVK
jgi:hypothetical protein